MPGKFLALCERKHESQDLVDITLPPPMILAVERHQLGPRYVLGEELAPGVPAGAVTSAVYDQRGRLDSCEQGPHVGVAKPLDHEAKACRRH